METSHALRGIGYFRLRLLLYFPYGEKTCLPTYYGHDKSPWQLFHLFRNKILKNHYYIISDSAAAAHYGTGSRLENSQFIGVRSLIRSYCFGHEAVC